MINQCDGCMRGLPVKDGIHFDGEKPYMGCTKDRYESVIDKIIIGKVRCVKCGAGYGACDCWVKCKCGWHRGKDEPCNNPECVLNDQENEDV